MNDVAGIRPPGASRSRQVMTKEPRCNCPCQSLTIDQTRSRTDLDSCGLV